jgi:hypothetical protein
LCEVRVIRPQIAARFNAVGGNLVVLVKPKLGHRHKIASGIVAQHRLGALREPPHGLAQLTRGKGDQEIFGIRKALHAEPAAHIGDGHTDRVLWQREKSRQPAFHPPNALSTKAQMRTPLHRVCDHAVVRDFKFDPAHRSGKGGLGGRFIPQPPVKRQISGGLGVQRLSTRMQPHGGFKLVILEFDQLCGFLGDVQRVGNNHRHSFADKPNPPFGQMRPQRRGPFCAIKIGHK